MRKMIGTGVVCMTAWLAVGTCALAQNWTGTKLNDLAVKDGGGAIIVLGTEGSYDNNGRTKETVFDGLTATYFDPPQATARAEPCWAGFELPAPKMVTRIRYFGRGGYPHRMRGCLFQGADTSDFTDAVTLHVANPPTGWLGTNAWVDVTLNTTNAFRTFRYLRIFGPTVYTVAGSPAEDGTYAGNVAEVEFYGADLTLDALPSAPVLAFSNAVNWRANLKWTVTADTLMYEVQRRLGHETEFTTVLLAPFGNTGEYIWADSVFLASGADYRICAINNIGDSGWVDIPLQPLNAASGAWFGSPGSYSNNGMVGDKLYDGDITTFFDGPDTAGNPPFWSALDLGKPREITGLRFIPRASWQSRMVNGWFEAADNTNFNNAVSLHTITVAPPYDTMTEVTVSPPNLYRYVRYITLFSNRCNAYEIEFLLAPHEPRAPTGLTVTPSDITNAYAVLSWNPGDRNLVSSSIVHRATSPGGPYTALTPEGLAVPTWTDTTVQVGVLYYYKVSTLYTDGATVHEGPLSEYITYRRGERLERTLNDNTQLRAGVTAFRIGTPYNNGSGIDVDKLFDGDIGTYADINPANGTCVVGVNFGEPCGITGVRFVPRDTYLYRIDGAVLCGSNDLSSATVLATFSGSKPREYTWITVTDTNTYQYVYATKAGEFLGNFTELEFYGWREASAADVLTAPASVAFAPQASSLLLLNWTAGNNVTSYRVERTPADAPASWAVIGTTAALSFADPSPLLQTRCLYRVIAMRPDGQGGTEEAWSDSFPFIAYTAGNGTGLNGYYTSSYSRAYDPAETLQLTRVDAGIDFGWGTSPIIPGVPESAANVLVVWNGKLIVPFDGTYIFRATTDDGIALRINGAFVINEWNATGTRSSAPIPLTAGSYDIRMDYYQGAGNAYAHLEWDGAVTRAIIPAAQLIPADLPSEDIGPWRGRTFNAPRLGTHTVDTASGGIRISSGGQDFNGSNEGNHLVWQSVSGAFLLEAKIVLSPEGDTSAKAMLVMRNELAFGSPVLAAARIGQTPGKYGVKQRLAKGAAIADVISPAWQGEVSNPFWLRLKRVGKTSTMEVRNDGGDWFLFHTYEDTGNVFNSNLIVGLGVTSPSAGNTGTLPHAIFSDIRLVPLSGTVLIVQ